MRYQTHLVTILSIDDGRGHVSSADLGFSTEEAKSRLDDIPTDIGRGFEISPQV
jgi:hypothetical protein